MVKNDIFDIGDSDMYYVGILANVDSSILNLNGLLEKGFEIKSINVNKLADFLNRCMGSSHHDIRTRLFENKCVSKKLDCYIVCNSIPTAELTESDDDKAHNSQLGFYNLYEPYLLDLLRLLRLYKEGNIRLPFTHIYFFKPDKNPISYGGYGPELVHDYEKYHVNKEDMPKLKSFIEKFDLPFPNKRINLAFEHFEQSYSIKNINLKFLTLTNALEILLNPSSRDELRYRVSRNLAVLLGKNKEDSDKIYKKMKEFYDLRSSIVHNGTADITIEKVLLLRDYVRKSIITLSTVDKFDLIESTLTSSGFGDNPF